MTRDEANALLKQDLRPIVKAIHDFVKVPLTQTQFDALADFGMSGTGFLKQVVTELNQGNYDAVPGHMALYNKIKDPKTGQLVVSNGLDNRRTEEGTLFRDGIYP